MEILSFTLAAGQVSHFELAGRYLEIIDAPARVDVELRDGAGVLADRMRQAMAGFYSEEAFVGFSVTNPEAYPQDVRLMIADKRGGSRRQPGIVSIANKISKTITQFEAYGGGLLATGAQATPIILPAANPNGVLVRRADVTVTAGAGQADMAIVTAAAVTPGVVVPAAGYTLARIAPTGGAAGSENRKDLNLQLPAGWGVWIVSIHAVAPAAAGASLVYEPL